MPPLDVDGVREVSAHDDLHSAEKEEARYHEADPPPEAAPGLGVPPPPGSSVVDPRGRQQLQALRRGIRDAHDLNAA